MFMFLISACSKKEKQGSINIDIPKDDEIVEVDLGGENQDLLNSFDGKYNYYRHPLPSFKASFLKPKGFSVEPFNKNTFIIKSQSDDYEYYISFSTTDKTTNKFLQEHFRPIIMETFEYQGYDVYNLNNKDTETKVDKNKKFYYEQNAKDYREYRSKEGLKFPKETYRTLGYKEYPEIEFYNLKSKESFHKPKKSLIYYGFLPHTTFAIYGATDLDESVLEELITVAAEDMEVHDTVFVGSFEMGTKKQHGSGISFHLPKNSVAVSAGLGVRVFELKEDNEYDGITIILQEVSDKEFNINLLENPESAEVIKHAAFTNAEGGHANSISKAVVSPLSVDKNNIPRGFDGGVFKMILSHIEGLHADKAIKEMPLYSDSIVLKRDGDSRTLIIHVVGEDYQQELIEEVSYKIINSIR